MPLKLTKYEIDWVNALGTAFSPESDVFDSRRLVPRPGEVDYSGTFARLNGPAGLKVRVGVRLAVMFLATAPVWHWRRVATIDQLGAEDRERLVAELSSHPLQLVRELSLLMKVQVSMAKLGTPTVRARSAYDKDRDQGTPARLRLKIIQEVA